MIMSCTACTNTKAFKKMNKIHKIFDCYMNIEKSFSHIYYIDMARYAIKIYMKTILNCDESKNIWSFKDIT